MGGGGGGVVEESIEVETDFTARSGKYELVGFRFWGRREDLALFFSVFCVGIIPTLLYSYSQFIQTVLLEHSSRSTYEYTLALAS